MQAAMASARASQAPVARHKTIIAAFERQTKGKVCPACEKVIPLGVYRSHFNTCKAKIDEDECMITKIVTAEEKIGPPIVLDDDQTVNVGASTSTVQVGQRRRRSTRIAISYDEERDEKPVITKRMRMRMTMQMKEEVEQMETEKEPVRTREEMILQESGTIEDEEPPAIPKEEPEAVPEATEAEPDEPMPIEEENPPDDNTKLTETAQDNQQNVTHSGNLYEMIMNMDDTKLSSRSEEAAAPAAVVVAVEVKKTAVAKDEKEEEEVDRSESQAGVLQQKYFVSLVEKMIKKVIHSPGSLYGPSFWKDDYSIFKSFEALPSSDKQLLMRLFLRRAKWFTFIQLKERYSEYTAIKSILHNLVQKGLLEGGAKCITFDEICASVDLATLRKVAKTYQRDITLPKPQLIEALKKFAASQCDLFGRARGHEQGIVKMLLKECGDCFRVAESMKIAFKALFTLFSPTEMNSSLVIDDPKKNLESQLLYTLLTHENQTTKFVAPADCSSLIYIFYTYTELKKYIEAKELEIQIIFELFTNKLEVIEDREKEVRTLLYKQISNDEDLPPSVKRFTSKHVLVRVLSHLATAYEKKKMHSYAVNLHRLLLEDRNMQGYCSDSRGEWWTRLALNLEFHLKEPEEALKALEDGMADKCVLERDLVMLQDRALKLSKGQFAVRIQVEEPDEKTISAEVIRKNLGGARQNRFIRKRPDGTVVQCSVEEIARRHYLEKENFTYGVHSEGAIWHTVYGLFFFDIIFDHSQEGVWFSHIQTHPVDLNYPEFYTRRKSAFQDRLEWLMNAPEDGLKSKIDESWKMRDVANTEIDWNLFYDPDECLEFCLSCPRKVLCAVFQRLMKDYRNARSGFPDLTLWNPLTRTVVVSEVKGPGDRLSSKQRLWLQFFTKWGLRAEVCYVKADRILNI